jgi:hypothetical protein
MFLLVILKFILLTILWILAAVLFVVLLILFSPLSYEISGEKLTEARFNVKAGWLFSLLRLRLAPKDGQFKKSLKILFFELLGREKRPKKRREKVIETSEAVKSPENKEISTSGIKDEKLGKAEENQIKTEENKDETRKSKGKKDKNPLSKRLAAIRDKISSVFGKIEDIANYPDKGPIWEYTRLLIIALIKAFGVKKMKARAIIGFDDPSATGKAVGLIYALSSACNLDVSADADFTSQVFEISGHIKGRTNVFLILLPSVKYIFKKPIWKLITKIRKGND